MPWSLPNPIHTAPLHSSDKYRNYFSFNINVIQTDNGPEFSKYFHDCVERNNMRHRYIPPRSPNCNAHLERFNRTIQEEMPKKSLVLFKQGDVLTYLEHYNTKRLHMGIEYKTPSERLE